MKRVTHSLILCLVIALPLLSGGCSTLGAGNSVDSLLPDSGYAEGWALDGGVSAYDKETLTDHINGEAEIYFPHGFTEAAVATYIFNGNKDRAVAVDLYAMGTPEGAVGIYSNYKSKDAALVSVGTEGFFDGFQLMFHQDRYFVRMSAYGKPAQNKQDLMACATVISQKLSAVASGDSAQCVAGSSPRRKRQPVRLPMTGCCSFPVPR
jgi:uncharacterized protein DUF6599